MLKLLWLCCMHLVARCAYCQNQGMNTPIAPHPKVVCRFPCFSREMKDTLLSGTSRLAHSDHVTLSGQVEGAAGARVCHLNFANLQILLVACTSPHNG